ncbi:hypothetical protein HK101_008706 [Irineochytrium annulatum]|nr:hypothetical protein HK101_008706 [Irineochytrium annulatum]
MVTPKPAATTSAAAGSAGLPKTLPPATTGAPPNPLAGMDAGMLAMEVKAVLGCIAQILPPPPSTTGKPATGTSTKAATAAAATSSKLTSAPATTSAKPATITGTASQLGSLMSLKSLPATLAPPTTTAAGQNPQADGIMTCLAYAGANAPPPAAPLAPTATANVAAAAGLGAEVAGFVTCLNTAVGASNVPAVFGLIYGGFLGVPLTPPATLPPPPATGSVKLATSTGTVKATVAGSAAPAATTAPASAASGTGTVKPLPATLAPASTSTFPAGNLVVGNNDLTAELMMLMQTGQAQQMLLVVNAELQALGGCLGALAAGQPLPTLPGTVKGSTTVGKATTVPGTTAGSKTTAKTATATAAATTAAGGKHNPAATPVGTYRNAASRSSVLGMGTLSAVVLGLLFL